MPAAENSRRIFVALPNTDESESVWDALKSVAHSLLDSVHVQLERSDQHDADLSSLKKQLQHADVVLADFTPDAHSGLGSPDAVGVAALARYCCQRRLGLFAPPDADLPFDWKKVRAIRYEAGRHLKSFKGEVQSLFIRRAAPFNSPSAGPPLGHYRTPRRVS